MSLLEIYTNALYNCFISTLTPNAFSSADAALNATVLRMLYHKRYMSNLHHLFNNINILLVGYNNKNNKIFQFT